MKQKKLSYKIQQYLMFAGPGTVLFLAVVIVPFIYGLYLTMTSWDGGRKRSTVAARGQRHKALCLVPELCRCLL